jgi:hypothetical protein
LTTVDETQEPLDVLPVMGTWVRGALVGLALCLSAVFALAVWLKPYDADGRPLRMQTHQQLGLPPCSFYTLTTVPCPSCGMTTSFALFVRGDLLNSLRANAAGTLLAVLCLLLIPWSVASVLRGRTVCIRSVERTITVFVLLFLGVMLIRWAIVLVLGWSDGTYFGPRAAPAGTTERTRRMGDEDSVAATVPHRPPGRDRAVHGLHRPGQPGLLPHAGTKGPGRDQGAGDFRQEEDAQGHDPGPQRADHEL